VASERFDLTVQLPGEATIAVVVDPEPTDDAFDPFGHGRLIDRQDFDLIPPVRARIRRLDVVYTRKFVEADGGVQVPVPGWRQVSLEQDLLAPPEVRARLRDLLFSLRERVAVQDSGREDWSNFALAGGTDETDGTGLFVNFTSAETAERRQFAVIGHTETWQRQVPPVERLEEIQATYDALPTQADQARVQGALDAARAHAFENWGASVSPERVHKTGTLEAHVAPRRWAVGWESERHFNECDPTDTERYRTVRIPNPEGEAADEYALGVAFDLGAEIEIWVTPQIHNLLVTWIDVYAWTSLFSTGYIFIPQQRQWRDTLPWEPQPYRVTAIGNAGNDNAMSEKIQRSNGYAAMINAGYALQVVGSLFSLSLAMRINGTWNLFSGRYYAGELAGILRIEAGVGAIQTLYVFNRVDQKLVPLHFDGGDLNTDLVYPDFGFLPSHVGWRP
jgi:hypothetical protein